MGGALLKDNVVEVRVLMGEVRLVEHWRRPAYTVKSVLLLAILVAAGFVGNYFAPGLFTGFNFLFGSIPVLLAVHIFGVRWGFVAGLVASSWTIVLFGHPYAMVWLCCEPLFVGWLLSKSRLRNIFLCDALYWPLLGAPLIWIFFQYVMHVSILGTIAAMLMYWVIGITNALIASLLLTYLPRLSTAGEQETQRSIPIHLLIFNLLMAIVVFPSVIVMILNGKDAEQRHLDEMLGSIDDSSRIALYETKLKLQKQQAVLSELMHLSEQLEVKASGEQFNHLQMAVELLQKSYADFQAIYVGDVNGNSIARFPSRDKHGRSIIRMDYSDREYFKVLKETHSPVISNMLVTRGAPAIPGVVIAMPILSNGSLQGYAAASVKTDVFRDILLKARINPQHLLTLVDGTGKVIASTNNALAPLDTFASCAKGTMTRVTSGSIYRCMPNQTALMPLWQRAQKSSYILTSPLANETSWSISVETPFGPYQRLLFKEHIKSLLTVLSLNMLALVTSLSITRRLTAPLRRLSQVTTDLPDRLLHENVKAWPKSRVTEIDQLIDNFRVMSAALRQKFQEITQVNENLELRVEERTKEITLANEELQREIAERKLTERQRDYLTDELVSHVQFLQTLINTMPNPVYYKDLAGRYQGCNRAFEECLGISRLEIVGKSVNDLFPPTMAWEYDKSDQELFKRPGVQVCESQMHFADGQPHAVIFYKATYQDIQGQTAGLVGTIVDISERKKAETERDHLMVELKQKNKELEGIVYVASHDLRSPLVNVQGFSRKLGKSCSDLIKIMADLEMDEATRAMVESIASENIPKALKYITGSVEKMDGLLSGLLRLSRLGRAAICFDTIDMNAILAKIVASMTYQIETAGARVEVGRLGPCLADGEQVTQIFSNLLDNAVKYRSPERPLFVKVSSEEFPEGIRYCVEDNGIGIPRDQQDKIWEVFQRLNPYETQGEGLGLTLARRIVDRLGGSIWVESEIGIECRFYVVLPKPYVPD